MRRGIEKESLRVSADGGLATTPHPRGLGSALTHPTVTTDFSEVQVELITGTHASGDECLAELTAIHQVVYQHIGDELLWCASMPGELPSDASIPIAQYGRSNLGRVKTVYRIGLTNRYGPRMQMISGIHYNFSLPEEAWAALQWTRDEGYFSLIRNFRRHSWLLLYLLGASPAVRSSFVAGRAHRLQALGEGTLYAPHATSLRMGPLGYRSEAQASIEVSYNGLEAYAETLERALIMPHQAYEAIGLRDGDDYRQLATSLLQIENEFYGTIRPKRTTRSGERPLHGLRERGVEYVEVRLIDLDPFAPTGITKPTQRLLDVFLLHCLLSDSPPETPREAASIALNQHRVAERGREEGLALERDGRSVTLRDWGTEVLQACGPIAAILDEHVCAGHADALNSAVAALANPGALPSARVLDEMVREHGGAHARFALARSLLHAGALRQLPVPAAVAEQHARTAQRSREAQREIEAADTLPFESFRQQYLSPQRLRT
jgi:glutamate--cysteine ligase